MIHPPTRQNINKAAKIVQNGGLIAYPTETVYGLGVDPFNPEAIAKIFAAKGRPENKGIILLIQNRNNLTRLTRSVPQTADSLMDAFWPGPLTLIFKAHPDLPSSLLGGLDTVALRHSISPIATQLLSALGGPITSTSANRSGQPPCRSAQEVQDTLGDRIDLILDSDQTHDQPPSTLIDTAKDQPIILREGVISTEALSKYIPK